MGPSDKFDDKILHTSPRRMRGAGWRREPAKMGGKRLEENAKKKDGVDYEQAFLETGR